MKTYAAALRTSLAALVLALAGLAIAGCDDDTATTAKPDAGAAFKSIKPGSGSSNTGGEKADAGTSSGGAPQDDTTKVEEGDVAKLVGKTLYVLNQWRGLQIVDLQDPAKPKLQARVAMTGVPREMYIDGSEAIVALSQVAQLGAQDGKPLAQAGSQIRRVSLGAAPKEVASLHIPGYIAATKRIGNKLIVVAPQVSWNPWWYGCWGPYGCMDAAGGGVKTGTATAGASDTASSGASIAYPGGYYYGGYNAEKTKVVVVDLAIASTLSQVSAVEIDGGVLASSIEIGEVLIASQQWVWKDSSGTQTERLSQILLGSDGKLTLGAIAKLELPYKSDSSQSMISAYRLAAGRMAIGRQGWQVGKSTYAVESWQVQAGAWKKTAAWQKDAGPYGARLVVDGTLALFATSDYASKDDPASGTDDTEPSPGTEPQPGTDKSDAGSTEPAVDGGSAELDAGIDKPDAGIDKPDAGTDKPWGADIGLDVLDLADPATVSLASHATMTSGGWDLWSMQLTALEGERWLVTRRGSNYSEVELQVLELADPKLPQWLGKLKITSDYGMQAEVLSAQLLAVPVMTKTGGGQVGVQLISLAANGDLAARGIFASSYIYWYQLKNLLADQTLLRIANAGLEVVDLANLDLPMVLGTLELAANVVDTAALGDRLVTLVSSWKDNKFWLRVLPVGGTDELNPEGQIACDQQWGKLYVSGQFVYVANGQTVQVYDLSDPKNPKARGKFVQDSGAYTYWDDGKSLWWNTWDMPQKGTTLYVIGQQVDYTKASGAACNPSSGGGSSGGSGEVPAVDASTPAPEPADASATDPDLPDASGTDKPPIDAGSGDADEKPIEDGYSGTCWINPLYTTKIAALDLSDPDNPKLGGTLDLKGVGWTQDAQVTGNVLALTHYQSLQGSDGAWYGSYWLDRVDITAAAAPKLLDQTNIPGWLVGLSADGKSAVTLDWQLQTGSKPEDSKVVNTLNAVTLASGKATLKKSVALTSQAGATLRHGDAVYVSTWPYWWMWPAAESAGTPINTELLVFDASDPAKFAQSASLQSGAGVSSLQVAGKHLFAQTAAGLGLTVWSLANPTQPVYQSFLPAQGGWGARVVALGGQAYIPAGWYGISAYPLQ